MVAIIPARAVDAEIASVTTVASIAELKATDQAQFPSAYLIQAGRGGWFHWRTGDYLAEVAADTQNGLFAASDTIAATTGAWVRDYDGLPNVKWFGAVGDGVAADLAALQASTDLCQAVFVPHGTYLTDGPWLLDDYATIIGMSRLSVIRSTSANDIIRGRGHSTSRNFHIFIERLKLDGIDKSVNGINFLSGSMCKVRGLWIQNCNVARLNGGTGAQGAFYNRDDEVDVTTCNVGWRNGTLGNENMVTGGRATDVSLGTDDDNNTCNTYIKLPVETFTTAGHRVSNSGSASQRTRFIWSRLENVGGVGIGIDIKAAAQSTVIAGEFHTGLSTGIADSGTGTDHIAAY